MQSNSFSVKPSALSRYRLFESTDVDETQQRIGRIFQPHRLTAGPTKAGRTAYMNYAPIENIAFGSICYAGAMNVDVGEIDDYFVLIVNMDGFADVSLGSRRLIVGQSQGVVLGPSHRFSATFSVECKQFFLRISREALIAHSGYEQLRIEPSLDLTRRELQPLLMQLHALTVSPELVSLAQQNRRIAVDLERLIVGLLLSGQPHHSQERVKESESVPKAIRRAEAFIAEHACEALRISDIAAAAGVPTRTLLHSFKRFRETSPMQMVREARLSHSRQLLMGASDRDRVADIALGCGFVNLGRYAQAYRAKFGETPSETLRRTRQTND